MPNPEITAADADSLPNAASIKAHYSPKLCNADLAPTKNQSWS